MKNRKFNFWLMLLVGIPAFIWLLVELVRVTLEVINRFGMIGGLLNALAWYTLRDRDSWNSFFRIWCLVLLFVGLFGAQIARWLLKLAEKRVAES